jgi:uncharacterized protein
MVGFQRDLMGLWRTMQRTMFALVLAAVLIPPSELRAQDYPDVSRTSIYVPVRDGTRLAIHIYRPATTAGVVMQRLPVIFAFTPYRARFFDEQGAVQEVAMNDRLALRSLIRAGYVVAVADIRGKGASFGTRRGFQDRTEALDGRDLVEWLADQDFSTGNVGMMGCSYLGGTTTHVASTAPPSLRAIFTGATDWDKYDFVRQGGITAQFNTRPDEPLSVDLASVPVDGDDGSMLRAAVAQHAANTPMGPLWYGMPYRDSVSPLTGNAFWQEAAFWQYADVVRDAGIATYMWSNWEDEPTAQVLVTAKNLGSRMLVGPGSHCVPPPDFDFVGEVVRYFDFHLKGIDNGFSAQAPVTYWVETGPQQGYYRRTAELPGTTSSTTTWYLGAHDGAAVGRLAPRPVAEGQDLFTVNYAVPSGEYFAFWPAPLDAQGILYDSSPLRQPLDLLGYPVAHITLRASVPDAEVFAYLEEVTAAGEVRMLSFGRLALAHRATSIPPWDNLGLPWHSGRSTDVAPLPAGEAARLSIAMQPLSRRIASGSRLRFVITGADPRQRNLVDMRQDPAPQFTILTGWEAGSRLDLPLAEVMMQEPGQ